MRVQSVTDDGLLKDVAIYSWASQILLRFKPPSSIADRSSLTADSHLLFSSVRLDFSEAMLFKSSVGRSPCKHG